MLHMRDLKIDENIVVSQKAIHVYAENEQCHIWKMRML